MENKEKRIGKEVNKTDNSFDTLDLYIKKNVTELKNITYLTMRLYEKQCIVLKRQINNLRRIKPPVEYKDAYLKWQKELNILEERYEKAFDKYLDEKKELDNVSRLYWSIKHQFYCAIISVRNAFISTFEFFI